MGRKGGGRAGFMKQARHIAADAEEQEAQEQAPAAAPVQTPAPAAAAATHAGPAVSSKAAAFLKDAPAAASNASKVSALPRGAPASSDGGDEEPAGADGQEPRGQLLQRHKRVRLHYSCSACFPWGYQPTGRGSVSVSHHATHSVMTSTHLPPCTHWLLYLRRRHRTPLHPPACRSRRP